ncbi:hypothetical protein [Streptacidiphilus sp. EB103A]|uniref:hypothetical protein n=1 Tax=Streptacidiphilus sp. EB103A TaxID=3156275 RepID=UPI003513E0F1
MGMIEGVLIAESIKLGAELSGIPLTLDSVRRVAATDATADQPKAWTLINFRAEQVEADQLAARFAEILDAPGWYADFHTDSDVYVVFPGKVFRYSRGDRAGREQTTQHARSIGFPDSQLDWTD